MLLTFWLLENLAGGTIMQNKGGLETSSLLYGLFRLNLKSDGVIFERSKVSLPNFYRNHNFRFRTCLLFAAIFVFVVIVTVWRGWRLRQIGVTVVGRWRRFVVHARRRGVRSVGLHQLQEAAQGPEVALVLAKQSLHGSLGPVKKRQTMLTLLRLYSRVV